MKKLLLIGAGGHCRSVIDVIHSTLRYKIVGIIGLEVEKNKVIDGITVVGTDNELMKWVHQTDECLITVGQIGKSDMRKKLWEKLFTYNVKMATIVSSHAYVSATAKLSPGTIIMHHAIINANANIGNNCIINTRALVEHDATVGDHSHIATGAIINGNTTIGSSSFVGSGVTIYHGLQLKNNTVIPAGSTVSNNI